MKIYRILLDNRGGAYIELTFAILFVVWLIAIFIGVFPVFVKISKVTEYAEFSARMIALEGGITDRVEDGMEKYRELAALEGAKADFSESEFLRGQEIQLNSLVSVKVSYEYKTQILGIPFSIPISSTALSRSEVYHK